MSRPRARKALVATCDGCPRGRGSVARASGDTALTQEPQKNHRSKSRNKIPKSIRYDLENALVGLCNVWFEDIKPHLLRNNIKVHVSCAGAEGEAGAPPSPESPPAPHSCSHLDPGAASDVRVESSSPYTRQDIKYLQHFGPLLIRFKIVLQHLQRRTANCADCYTTRPTASSAPSRKPRVSRCPLLPPLSASPRTPQKPYPNCEAKSVPSRNLLARHKPRAPRPTEPLSWKFTRPCRTFSLSPPIGPTKTRARQPTRKIGKKNKAIQTDFTSIPRQASDPEQLLKDSISPSPRTRRAKLELQKSQQTSSCDDRQAASSRLRSRSRSRHFEIEGPLFKNDLIDIIGDVHDKKIKLLYESPRKAYSSIMNLVLSPKKKKRNRKISPWKY